MKPLDGFEAQPVKFAQLCAIAKAEFTSELTTFAVWHEAVRRRLVKHGFIYNAEQVHKALKAVRHAHKLTTAAAQSSSPQSSDGQRWYTEKRRDPRWQRKRLEVMKRDNFRCVECGTDQATLNVHHLRYVKGAQPWEYENSNLETLCEDCHKQRHHRPSKVEFTQLCTIVLGCWRQGQPSSCADWSELVKARCARLGFAYHATDITRAMAAVQKAHRLEFSPQSAAQDVQDDTAEPSDARPFSRAEASQFNLEIARRYFQSRRSA